VGVWATAAALGLPQPPKEQGQEKNEKEEG